MLLSKAQEMDASHAIEGILDTSTGNVGGDVLPKLHCCNDFSLAVQHLRWGTSLLCLMGFWRT